LEAIHASDAASRHAKAHATMADARRFRRTGLVGQPRRYQRYQQLLPPKSLFQQASTQGRSLRQHLSERKPAPDTPTAVTIWSIVQGRA
jgi:hypothetical protein